MKEVDKSPSRYHWDSDMHFFVYLKGSYMVLTTERKNSCHRGCSLWQSQSRRFGKSLEPSAWGPNSCSKWWRFGSIAGLQSRISLLKFEQMVETARGLIRNGDMFQCILSWSYWKSIWLQKSPRDQSIELPLFLRIWGIIKSSELVLKVWFSVKNGIVTTNPIAGHDQGRTTQWREDRPWRQPPVWWGRSSRTSDVGRLRA